MKEELGIARRSSTLDIYYREEQDRWIRGDRFVRPMIRRALGRRPPYLSGMQMVVRNFLRGLERRGVRYRYNPAFALSASSPAISFGIGLRGLTGIRRSRPVIAAVGFPHPAELPNLCSEFTIGKFLQHSEWVLDLVRSANRYDPSILDLWPAGVDTEEWIADGREKDTDFVLYNKVRGGGADFAPDLVQRVRQTLEHRGYRYIEVTYQRYLPPEYRTALRRSRAMIFLSAHESQGLAYQEALSCNVPVLAWDPGLWLDPARFAYGTPVVKATSVPFFDERCGDTFANAKAFDEKLPSFVDRVRRGDFAPRDFVQETVSIERSTDRMLSIFREV